MIKGFW